MLDLEMTGLDPVKDEIIEVACFVVEGATLERVPGTELCLAVMPEDPSILDKMDDWNTRTHNESGLVRRVREEGVPIGEAEEEVGVSGEGRSGWELWRWDVGIRLVRGLFPSPDSFFLFPEDYLLLRVVACSR